MEDLKKPIAPNSPDYEGIIEEELKKITNKSLANRLRRLIEQRRKGFNFINIAQNDARVESFVASTIARMEAEYNIYCMELDTYEANLKEYNHKIDEKIRDYDEQKKYIEHDFELAKSFYKNFRDLVSQKISFVDKLFKRVLKSDDDKGIDDSEEKETTKEEI